jgi:hypothetical protein
MPSSRSHKSVRDNGGDPDLCLSQVLEISNFDWTEVINFSRVSVPPPPLEGQVTDI